MCTVNWELTLEYLKVLLNWPPLLTAVFIFFVNLYKKEIGIYLENLKVRVGTGKGTVEVFSEPPPQIAIEPQTGVENNLPNPPPTEAKEIESYPEILKDDPIAPAQIHLAKTDPIKYVAKFKEIAMELYYERCHARIYGTQLKMLHQLAYSPMGVRLADLSHYFTEHKILIGQPENQFIERYMQYLIDSDLIFIDQTSLQDPSIDAVNPLYKITPIGKAFYDYVQKHYPIGIFYKPY